MLTLPTLSELAAYGASLLNIWFWAAASVIGLMEVVSFFARHDWQWLKGHRWKLAGVLLVVAQFGAYQNAMKARTADVQMFNGEIQALKAEIARLDAALHPPIQIYMRDPESWLWNGIRYPQNARIALDQSTQVEMPIKANQRLNLTVQAPLTQRLTDVNVFLSFSRPVASLMCDPSRPIFPPAWTPTNNNTHYATIRSVNPGGSAGPYEAFCFSVDEAGPGDVPPAVEIQRRLG